MQLLVVGNCWPLTGAQLGEVDSDIIYITFVTQINILLGIEAHLYSYDLRPPKL